MCMYKHKTYLGEGMSVNNRGEVKFGLALLLHAVLATFVRNSEQFFAVFQLNAKFLGNLKESDFLEYTPLTMHVAKIMASTGFFDLVLLARDLKPIFRVENQCFSAPWRPNSTPQKI